MNLIDELKNKNNKYISMSILTLIEEIQNECQQYKITLKDNKTILENDYRKLVITKINKKLPLIEETLSYFEFKFIYQTNSDYLFDRYLIEVYENNKKTIFNVLCGKDVNYICEDYTKDGKKEYLLNNLNNSIIVKEEFINTLDGIRYKKRINGSYERFAINIKENTIILNNELNPLYEKFDNRDVSLLNKNELKKLKRI